jgi:TATA-binding protein-associated factor Taf7
MRSTLTTIVVAIAVVVALIGAVGFVSADVTSQQDTALGTHNGPVGTMADYAPGQFGEMMHGLAADHVPGMNQAYDDRGAHHQGAHHASHAGDYHDEHDHAEYEEHDHAGEYHEEHDHDEYSEERTQGDRNADYAPEDRQRGHGGHC